MAELAERATAAERATMATTAEPATYLDLLAREDGPPGSTWGLFGERAERAERGAANFAGAEQIRSAAALVSRGRAFNLDYALDAFDPALFAPRGAPRHEMTSAHADQRDDVVRDFHPQASSQIDGLRHRRASGVGFYNGVAEEHVTVGDPALGIQRWAEDPIVGRGVMVDVGTARAERGTPIDLAAADPISLATVERALTAQGTAVRRGDLLLVHTGWAAWYLDLDERRRAEVRERGTYPGLAQSTELLAWLYDHRIALAATDTPAFEAVPPIAASPFAESAAIDRGMMHQELISKLGLPIGELWKLDELATACRVSVTWEFLLTAKPLNLVGGVGSPPNAVAIW